MHSFCNRKIFHFEEFSFRPHKELNRLFPPPLLFLLFKRPTASPKYLNSPPSLHWLYDLQHTLNKLMHFLPHLSDFVRLKNGFNSFSEQTV